jgi:DNA-binding transcriptional MerR regulator
METKLTLEELADQSGLPIRTIRYYIQVGLLDGPDTHGKFASYSPEHLDRLELISRLKDRTHLPLEEISKLFRHGTPEQIQQMRDILNHPAGRVLIINTDETEEKVSNEPGASALDYIRNIDRVQYNTREILESPAFSAPEISPSNSLRSSYTHGEIQGRVKTREENWQRIWIGDGIELHVRATREKQVKIKIQELTAYARKLFGNEW